MVWYNITAYNIKVKFVLRNNKEKVICNNKNDEGEMQMKCSKNLERAIVMGLILSTGVCGSAWAKVGDNTGGSGEYIEIKPDDNEWIGKMNKNGEGAKISSSGEFSSINVYTNGVAEGYDNWSDLGETTTALLIGGYRNEVDVTVNGPVSIINEAVNEENKNQQTIDNNNALYVSGHSTFTINGSDNKVYIKAIDGAEERSSAISVREGSTVNISGNNVQIVGNIDFISQGGSKSNAANLTLKTSNSFWYGNEGQAANVEQLTDVINEVAEDVVEAQIATIGFAVLDKEACVKILNPSIENVLNNFGGGDLDLTLSNGAEWVYDSNGKTEAEFTDDMIMDYIPPELMKMLDSFPNLKDEFLSNLKEELRDIIDVTLQSEVSRISAITLNGGVVNLQDDDIKAKYADYIGDLSKYKEHHKVTIGELKGNGGIFKVDLDWDTNKDQYGLGQKNETENSDYIYIEKVGKDASGSQQIVDFDASKAHLENMEINKDKLYFANVADGNTSFTTLSSVYSNAGNVFDYTYGTGSEKGTNGTDNKGTDWYIAVSGKSAESNPNFSAAKGAMYAGYALGTELDTLNKRMGEARYLEEDDGVWVRYRHSKTGWDDTYETNGDMFQLGFDNEVTEKDGKHYRGVAIDYTDADTSIMGISGDGEHERYAVSLYDTWLGEKGHYRDLVLRGGRINSDYDVSGAFSSGYEDIGGDYHQWFGSISAEWGRKNDMGTGWYFEPQVQAQLARIGGASYVSDSGVDVDQDGATSLIGRAGFRIGREYVKDNGKHDNFYIKADLLHEFAGDKSFSLTGNDGRYDKEYDGQETWCDVGIGADISLGKNSYFWADVERTFGADFDNTWQINGGFRWEF